MKREITLFPFGWQHEALDLIEKNRIFVCAGGRGVGKSNLFQISAIREAFRAPKQRLIYAAQSYKVVKEMYLQMLNAEGFSSLLRAYRPVQEQPSFTINFCNGSRLNMITVGQGQNAGRALGLEATALYMDECLQIPEQVYLDLSPCVSRLRGRTVLLSTFRHRLHWFTNLYLMGQTPNSYGIKSMKVPSQMGICYQGVEGRQELEKERAIRTERIFARDFLCEFVDSDKAVFRKDLILRAQVKGLMPVSASKEATLLCWDLGRRADPASILLGNLHGQLYHSETIKLGVDWNIQVKRVKQLADLYNSSVIIESNGTVGDSVIDLMKPMLLPHTLRANPMQRHNKENMMNRIVFRLEKGPVQDTGLIIPDHPMFSELCRELEALEYKETPSYVGYTSEIHDDQVSALALYCEALHKNYGGQLVSAWNDNARPTRYL